MTFTLTLRCSRPARAAALACVALASCMRVPRYVEQVDTVEPARVLRPRAQPPDLEPVATARPPEPPPQTIILRARDATVHGKQAKYEVAKDRDNIGFWLDPNDWVSWECTPRAPARFLVQLTWACPGSDAGSGYAIRVGDQEVAGTVASTGNWGKFETTQVGIVDIKQPGPCTVAVRYTTKRNGALMNLQAITLRSGQWDPGLEAWWRFDEGRGTATFEPLTGAEDAVHFARWTAAGSGSALRFNGFSSYVSRAAAVAPSLKGSFSLEAWVKLLGTTEGWCPIVNQHEFPLGFFFGLDGAGALALHLAAGGRWLACTSTLPLPRGRWTHVAATYDPSGGAAVYIDGREAGRLVAGGAFAPAEGVDLLIGRHNRHPWYFDGLMNDVRIYSRALAPSEVRSHWERGRPEGAPPPLIAIRGVRPDRFRALPFERVTLDVDLDATCENPFDAADVRLDAEVAAPSGATWTAPGFFIQPFRRRLVTRKEGDKETAREAVEPLGAPGWQVRLAFAEPGPHQVTLRARDRTGKAVAAPLTIVVEPGDAAGMVRRSGSDPRYFVTDRGESFFPIGANVCWADARGTYAYDRWLADYAAAGCNYFRLWLSPFWTTLGLNTAASGFDEIDQAKAARLDHVLETAERLGLRAMLCIDSFSILRHEEQSPGNFESTPNVRGHGGPLDTPAAYFSNPWMLAACRNRLRYLVARWGYSPSVFAWELWNEVDIVEGYQSETIAAWHAAMATALRRMDPWRHLITTSYASPKGDPAVEGLPELDFLQPHSYGAKDMAKDLGDFLAAKAAAKDRPCFFGELGISGDGKQTSETDPAGIHLHNALFASVGQGQAGTPMSWWWDSYIEAKGLYPIYAAFAAWIQGFDFVAQKPRPADLQIVSANLETKESTTLTPVKGSYGPAPSNQPLTAAVDRDGKMTMAVPISELLHGTGFHKDLHNPVTFELDAPEPATFGVEIKGVSAYGNGRLVISLDGKAAKEEDLPVEGAQADSGVVHTYDGIHAIDLPAGKHTVKVENTGQDWVSVKSYRIPWLTAARVVADPLRASGLVGETMALVWVQSKLYTWVKATAKDFQPQPVKGAKLRISGLRPGLWTVEQIDTRTGKLLSSDAFPVAPDGLLTFPLPEISWDAAYRLRTLGHSSRGAIGPCALTGDAPRPRHRLDSK